MQGIFSNPDWTYLIAILGLVFGILSIIITLKFPFHKELLLANWTNVTIPQTEIDPKKPVTPIHELILAFQCQSKVPILKTDLVKQITIELENVISIRFASIQCNNKYNSISCSVISNKFTFDFDFLEPKDFIQISIKYEANLKSDGLISGKIIGGNELNYIIESNHRWGDYYRSRKVSNANFQWLPITTIISFALLTSIFARTTHSTYEILLRAILRFDKESWILILIGIILLLISLRIGFLFRNLAMPFSESVKKNKKWHTKGNYRLT